MCVVLLGKSSAITDCAPESSLLSIAKKPHIQQLSKQRKASEIFEIQNTNMTTYRISERSHQKEETQKSFLLTAHISHPSSDDGEGIFIRERARGNLKHKTELRGWGGIKFSTEQSVQCGEAKNFFGFSSLLLLAHLIEYYFQWLEASRKCNLVHHKNLSTFSHSEIIIIGVQFIPQCSRRESKKSRNPSCV